MDIRNHWLKEKTNFHKEGRNPGVTFGENADAAKKANYHMWFIKGVWCNDAKRLNAWQY